MPRFGQSHCDAPPRGCGSLQATWCCAARAFIDLWRVEQRQMTQYLDATNDATKNFAMRRGGLPSENGCALICG